MPAIGSGVPFFGDLEGEAPTKAALSCFASKPMIWTAAEYAISIPASFVAPSRTAMAPVQPMIAIRKRNWSQMGTAVVAAVESLASICQSSLFLMFKDYTVCYA